MDQRLTEADSQFLPLNRPAAGIKELGMIAAAYYQRSDDALGSGPVKDVDSVDFGEEKAK